MPDRPAIDMWPAHMVGDVCHSPVGEKRMEGQTRHSYVVGTYGWRRLYFHQGGSKNERREDRLANHMWLAHMVCESGLQPINKEIVTNKT
jgi:hypothetical protein